MLFQCVWACGPSTCKGRKLISGLARLATEEADFRPALPMSLLPGTSEMQMATKLTYGEQLKHPNWQRRRLEIMEAASFECENCGDKDTTLNVHHKRYVKGRMVWEYEPDELQCLCETCHRTEHEAREALDFLLMHANGGLWTIVALVAGWLDGNVDLDEDFPTPEYLQQERDAGVLASIVGNMMPDIFHAAYLGSGVKHLSPAQQAAVGRWRDFAEKLGGTGL